MEGLQVVVKKLEDLFDIFNERYFENKLEKPVITVSPDDTIGAYGWLTTWRAWMQEGHDEGRYEINLCAEHLNRPFSDTCGTLVHEMVHLENLQLGIQDTSRGGTYHNKKFKALAEQRGLTVAQSDKYGWCITNPNEELQQFIDSMEEQGFKLWRTKINKPEKSKGSKKSSSRKYICPDCGTIIRATKEVRVICADCDVEMELEE